MTVPAAATEPVGAPPGDPARASKRERNKAANRAAILQAGREVFVEIGFGAANVRDIIRRTDLAAGTFYNYFPDKESVFRALVEESAEEIRVRAREARRRAHDARGVRGERLPGLLPVRQRGSRTRSI